MLMPDPLPPFYREVPEDVRRALSHDLSTLSGPGFPDLWSVFYSGVRIPDESGNMSTPDLFEIPSPYEETLNKMWQSLAEAGSRASQCFMATVLLIPALARILDRYANKDFAPRVRSFSNKFATLRDEFEEIFRKEDFEHTQEAWDDIQDYTDRWMFRNSILLEDVERINSSLAEKAVSIGIRQDDELLESLKLDIKLLELGLYYAHAKSEEHIFAAVLLSHRYEHFVGKARHQYIHAVINSLYPEVDYDRELIRSAYNRWKKKRTQNSK